jgi:hypothetical protein
MKKIIKPLLLTLLAVLFLVGCRESSKVSYNVSREADSFGVIRRVTVINMRSDNIVFEAVGNISIDTSSEEKLIVIAKTGEDTYKKHYINMTEWNMYVVEDVEGAKADKYKYEIRYVPEAVIPLEVITED